MVKRWRSRAFARGKFSVFIVAMVLALVVAGGSAAAASLTVSPTVVTFAPTAVGSLSYQMVTITNSGADADYIYTATTSSNPPFWPTYGGTCNTSIGPLGENYYIPAGGSCTFQWGFNPAHPGKQTGTGTISFTSGTDLTVILTGKGTPH